MPSPHRLPPGTALPQPPTVPDEGVPPRRVDLGRIAGVPIMTGLLVLNAAGILRTAGASAWTPRSVAELVAQVLSVCFYVLLISAFLRRSAAKATHPSWVAAVAAFVATWLPFALPLVPHGSPGALSVGLAITLLVVGLTFSVWALSCLDRSFSMMAQARSVVRAGPYALVRHPLYTGELVALLGTAMLRPALGSLAIWAAILGLQVYRARHEEAILLATLDDYADYQRSTPRLVPLAWARALGRPDRATPS